jgi:hypothetical protein
MRTLGILLAAAGLAGAAQTYTATRLNDTSQPTVYFANLMGLNNNGVVLGDACNTTCYGVDRFPALWNNGKITPLMMPMGHVYLAALQTYAINDSNTVVGTVQDANDARTHVALWQNGNASNPSVLGDAPVMGACTGTGCACNPMTGSSTSYGLNSAGHIVGSTSYLSNQPGGQGCSGVWVYEDGNFRTVQFPFPPQCYVPEFADHEASVGWSSTFAINDADQVLGDIQNFFCGPPYINPNPPFPSEVPVLIQPNQSYSYLPLGSLTGASGGQLNNLGQVHGFIDDNGVDHVIIWDSSGPHDLGRSGYAWLNNVGQVTYLGPQGLGGSCWESGCIAMWQNGVATPLELPANLFGPDDFADPAQLNDAGQFTIGDGAVYYLMTPSGSCGQNVTSEVQVTRGGFRYNHTTGHFTQEVTVVNSSGSPISGPISLALDNVPSNATLFGIAGDTLCDQPQGSPYLNISSASLAVGASVTGTVEFIDTAQTGITYGVRVLAGAGGR